MKIYTKTGDNGTTALIGGTRVKKHHVRIETYGTVDELNSWLGLIRDQEIEVHFKEVLLMVQNKLFVIGSILATDPKKEINKKGGKHQKRPEIKESDIKFLETEIDRMNDSLAMMTHFILPGGHPTVSYCHIARTVCRRAERMATLLQENEPFNPLVMSFLNRLSDYLFVLARKLSQDKGSEEIKWMP